MRKYRSPEKNILLLLIMLGFFMLVFFGFKEVLSVIRVAKTGLELKPTRTESIRGWMTLHYVAEAFDVPEDYLFGELGLEPEKYLKKSLSAINRELYPGKKGALIESVKALIDAYRNMKSGSASP
jgi:hypothetical protein